MLINLQLKIIGAINSVKLKANSISFVLYEIKKKKKSRNEESRSDLLLVSGEALADDLAFEGSSLVDGEVLVVLCQPSLALLVHQQHETDSHRLLRSK